MADAPTQFTILDMQDLPSPDPKRRGKMDRIVVYEIAPDNRAVLRMPKEEFTEDTLRAGVRAQQEERGQWLSKSFRL